MNNKLIIENIPFGVILHNSDGVIVEANKQVEQILKISLNKIIGNKWSELPFKVINKEGVECIIEDAIVTEVLTSGKDVKDQVVGIIHSGNREIIWINATILFKTFKVGNNPYQNQALMYLSDISSIISTNVAVENTINNLDLGSWQWDIDLGRLIFNDKWAKMLGYTIDELSPYSIDIWHKLIHPDDFKP